MAKTKRTINFVDRLSIPEQNVALRTEARGDEIAVEVAAISLPLPERKWKNAAVWPTAEVILKARCKVSDTYFEASLGTVIEVTGRSGMLLNAIMPGFTEISAIKFDLIVRSQSKMLLASLVSFNADNDKPFDRDNLLKTRIMPLEEESIRLIWEEEEPILLADKDYAEQHLRSPFTRALVLPPVIREILTTAVERAEDGEGEGWVDRWIQWAEGLNGMRPASGEEEESSQWVDGAVRKFANGYRLKSKVLEATATASE